MDKQILEIWKDIKRWLSFVYYTVGFLFMGNALSEAFALRPDLPWLMQIFLVMFTWFFWLPIWIATKIL